VQFDDHHLPIGELKYQIGYHFTVADFPTTVEDEVLNQERVVIDHDGQDEKVLLDFNGETAPDIQFSLPAYANEAQRIANEEQRIAHEAIRIVNEEGRIAAEQTRQQNEEQRIAQEAARVQEFARLRRESESATSNATAAATLANQKAQLAADKAALAQAAATLANAKAQLAADKAALAASAAQLANDKAALAQQKAEYAQTQGTYAKNQGDYAKQQGDYAKDQGDTALADHLRAEADHETAASDHTRAESDHSTASSDHTQAGNDHTRAESDHSTAASDHTTAGNDHTRAESDHSTAASDHTTAGNDHTRAESDHTRAESDHAAVEVYVDSLGAYDISAAHAVGGVLAIYANLQAALGTNGANIPEGIRKGGMSVKFIQGSAQSSDNKYVQYMYLGTDATTAATFTNVGNWKMAPDARKLQSTTVIPYSNFSIHGVVSPNGSITDAELSPYRRTNAITLKPYNAICVFAYANSSNASMLTVYSNAECTQFIKSNVGFNAMADIVETSYYNNTDNDLYIILCTKTPKDVDSFGLMGPNIFVEDVYKMLKALIDTEKTRAEDVEQTLQQNINTAFILDNKKYNTDFHISGIVNDSGEVYITEESNYAMTDVFILKNNQKITLRAYGSTNLNAIAVFGNSDCEKLQRLIKLDDIQTSGFGTCTYKNISGFDLYVICTTHKQYRNESILSIVDVEEPSGNILRNINDIYKEHGVCLWSDKTYVEHELSPYITRFVPVKENQLIYFYTGVYPSGYEVFSCNANKQYIESIINLRGSEYNNSLVKHYLTIRVPQGVNYIGISNREDSVTNPQLKQYCSDIYTYTKIRPIIKDYNFSPQKGYIAFVVDGGYDADDTLKALFDQKGIKAGWAPLFPQYMPGNHEMDVHMDWYMDWQNEGHEILTHSGSAIVWNDVDYSVPSNPVAQAAFAKMRIEQFRNVGFITRGFVQLGSQAFATEEARKPIYNSYEYGFTRATNTITEPDQGAVMMPTDKPWNLGRSTLEVITLTQMKSLIDECASKKGFLCIYCHSWRIGNQQYPNQTWETMEEMMDYALGKCVVDIPYNCIKALYANHIE
jgi:hypothetical protein